MPLRISMFVIVLACAALPTAAQPSHRAEVGVLYERFEAGAQTPFDDFGMDGFGGVLTVYLLRWFAFKAEVGGSWGRPAGVLASLYSYHFGIQLAWRERWPLIPWLHLLGGRSRIKFDVDTPEAFSVHDNTDSWVLGGGVDVPFHRHWVFRLAELSYVRTAFNDQTQNNWRIKSGFLFRW
ncbi:MAG: porin family protein [Acidobacteriia bacterium]|nr:porin family protein [Terriglobia bacterium]